jgi:hypothetical protein
MNIFILIRSLQISWYGGEEKNSQPLPRLEPPIIQPTAQTYITELSNVSS